MQAQDARSCLEVIKENKNSRICLEKDKTNLNGVAAAWSQP